MPRRTDALLKAQRIATVMAMRDRRASYEDIGKALSLSPSRCCQLYKEGLMNHPLSAIKVDEHRVEELRLIDVAIADLMGIALKMPRGVKGPGARDRVEAWNAVRGFLERKAKMLGLDAPTQHQHSTIDAIDQEIIKLQAELAVNDAA